MIENLDAKHVPYLKLIGEVADSIAQPSYVIGGYVRDFYLQRIQNQDSIDLDVVTIGSGLVLAEAVHKALPGSTLSTFKRFGTAMVKHKGIELEFVGARKESYQADSRKPVVEDGSLEDDQNRRDFTINALSWCLNEANFGELVDPFGGIKDLDAGLIKTPVDPYITFSDDPLRMLRAIRFATQLYFTIVPETLEAITKTADRIKIISKERIIIELNKILLSPKPSIGFAYLLETGLLKHILPEMVDLLGVDVINGQTHKDNFWHTLQVVDNLAHTSDNLYLRWSAVFHDIAKPATKRFHETQGWTFHGHEVVGARWMKRIFRRIGLPMDDRLEYVTKMVRLHQRPIALVSEEVTDSAIRRLIYEAGNDIEELMDLCTADITTKSEWRKKKYQNNFGLVRQKIKDVEERDQLRNWKNPITGEEIMHRFGIKPSKKVGLIKDAVKEAILDGDILNNEDQARDFMLNYATTELGLTVKNPS
jgi:tRNA nucleotidyltransferase (CCA-adding enzyme)